MLTEAQSGEILAPDPPQCQCCHSVVPRKTLKKTPSDAGIHWPPTAIAVRFRCDVTTCRRVVFLLVPSMTQYSKICSSSVPLQGFQGTLCVFHDLVNTRNLLPELPSWQENLPSTFAALHPSIPSTIQIGKLLSLFEKPRITSGPGLPILHQIHRICNPRPASAEGVPRGPWGKP